MSLNVSLHGPPCIVLAKFPSNLYHYLLSGRAEFILVQYLFTNIECSITPLPHGNAKEDGHGTHSYVRTKDSVKEKLMHASREDMPKAAFHKVNKSLGGIMKAKCRSDLPKGREQARYFRRKNLKSKVSINTTDSLSLILEQRKRQQLLTGKPFIQEVIGAPELRCVLAFKWQLEEIIQFCTVPANFSILGVDPTFNLGKFNLTVTTYKNLKVVDRRKGHNPMMIGPLLLSQTKKFDSYNYFFSKIVGLSKECAGVMVYGTDGEEELISALKRNFPQAIQLRCFGHFRQNCKDHLKQSNIPEEEQKEILDDLFGRRIEDVFEEGKNHCCRPY